MNETAYSLWHVVGFVLGGLYVGLIIGGMWGKSIQRKQDIWLFGPAHMQIGEPPYWLRRSASGRDR